MQALKAVVMPLDGKYYGTRVAVSRGEERLYVLTLWNSSSGEPSERELEGVCTIQQWRDNTRISALDWNGNDAMVPVRELYELDDSHYEDRATYQDALDIVERINRTD